MKKNKEIIKRSQNPLKFMNTDQLKTKRQWLRIAGLSPEQLRLKCCQSEMRTCFITKESYRN